MRHVVAQLVGGLAVMLGECLVLVAYQTHAYDVALLAGLVTIGLAVVILRALERFR